MLAHRPPNHQNYSDSRKQIRYRILIQLLFHVHADEIGHMHIQMVTHAHGESADERMHNVTNVRNRTSVIVIAEARR